MLRLGKDSTHRERFDEMTAFARERRLERQLASMLRTLHRLSYRQQIRLNRDFAPYSMGFDVYASDGRYRYSGGLIYQGPGQPANGTAPSFTVSSVVGEGWFLHS